jgi:hypothetical protein
MAHDPPAYDPRFDVDEPGHPNPIPTLLCYRTADDISPDRPATLIRIHGTGPDLMAVIVALFTAGINPITPGQLVDCQPRHHCRHLYALCDGHLTDTDIAAAVLPLTGPDGPLPHPVPPPFRI